MPDLRNRRRHQTEQAIIVAATELFLRDGYASTSLTLVAEHAGVAERTVYVRFETKAKLFQRVIDMATVGDTEAIPLPEQEWSRTAMTAPTLRERIEAFADGVSNMQERLGPLMAVNGEVEASEPDVHESAQAARDATVVFLRMFWELAERDRLLPVGVDLPWLIDTTIILSAAETRLIITRHLRWAHQTYRHWLVDSWWRLIEGAQAQTAQQAGSASA